MSFDTTREELQELFAQAGEITEVVVPTDRMSGRPRGFAFVSFATDEAAAAAIQTLDGKLLGGRNLRVNEASAERPKRSWRRRRRLQPAVRRRGRRPARRPGRLAAEGQPTQRPRPQALDLVGRRRVARPPSIRSVDQASPSGLGFAPCAHRRPSPSPSSLALTAAARGRRERRPPPRRLSGAAPPACGRSSAGGGTARGSPRRRSSASSTS